PRDPPPKRMSGPDPTTEPYERPSKVQLPRRTTLARDDSSPHPLSQSPSQSPYSTHPPIARAPRAPPRPSSAERRPPPPRHRPPSAGRARHPEGRARPSARATP